MLHMYFLLGWIGWIALLCALGFVVGYVKGERDARRADRSNEVNANDEKQS